jgi:argininosuccinate lyase
MLWGGRFTEPSDEDLRRLNDSLPFDKRMYKQDIRGSVAYARAIQAAGVITSDEADEIVNGLHTILSEFEADQFVYKPGDEDIHTAVERRLLELVGAVGGRLHTGRSRNDQVATDFRLWVIDAIKRMDEKLVELQRAIVGQAEQNLHTVMPGYTHMQPAQPITAAHWLMSFFWMLARDRERLQDAAHRTSVSPLGAGALAGTPFDVNRQALAEGLGFRSVSQNSLDAVSDRDFAAEFLFALSLTSVHLSRLAEDLIIYSNPAFGFITLNDRYSTGSSLMPQKRNADPMELARGKTGRIIGRLAGLLTTLKGLPSTYNKDIQEDKDAVFDAFDSLCIVLPVVTAIVNTLNINGNRMREGLTEDMLATDLADYLVRRGMPFRQAHHVVGSVVRLAAVEAVPLSRLPLDSLRELSDLFTADVSEVFDFDTSVARRRAVGGTAPDAVQEQIEAAKDWLRENLPRAE